MTDRGTLYGPWHVYEIASKELGVSAKEILRNWVKQLRRSRPELKGALRREKEVAAAFFAREEFRLAIVPGGVSKESGY
jgi:hypothetical protein